AKGDAPSLSGFEPARQRRVANEDRLAALGAGRDQPDGDADLRGDELDVVARRCRQLLKLRDALGRTAPAGQSLVDGLDLAQLLRDGREGLARCPVATVADADLDLVERVEDVELGQGDRVEAVDVGGVARGE